jgi:S-adenosylmethionine decarboxylase
MQGLHIVADFHDCECGQPYLMSLDGLREISLQWVRDVGLTPLNHCFHQFYHVDGSLGGVTGVVVLAESHLALHTWPESQQVTLDVYVCNFGSDNSISAHTLLAMAMAYFKPLSHEIQEIKRGQISIKK